jgi:hypothetical protein
MGCEAHGHSLTSPVHSGARKRPFLGLGSFGNLHNLFDYFVWEHRRAVQLFLSMVLQRMARGWGCLIGLLREVADRCGCTERRIVILQNEPTVGEVLFSELVWSLARWTGDGIGDSLEGVVAGWEIFMLAA